MQIDAQAILALLTAAGGFGTGIGTMWVRAKKARAEEELRHDELVAVKAPEVLMKLVDTLREELDRVNQLRSEEQERFAKRIGQLEEQMGRMRDDMNQLHRENMELKAKLYDRG